MNNTTVQVGLFSSPTRDHRRDVLLIVIYSVVLVSGLISISLMYRIMKCRAGSTTSITVLYLSCAHLIFLVTLPFRIYYYSNDRWMLSLAWCKVVSSLIHIHMYSCFFFYVIIIISRLRLFYKNSEIMASHSRILPVLLGAVVFALVFIVVLVVVCISYGAKTDRADAPDPHETTGHHCFHFGKHIKYKGVKVLNYVISTFIIVVSVVLTGLQVNVLRVLRRTEAGRQQLDHGHQQKSLLFALIMMACFVPYHIFRLHYLENLDLEGLNEVFLSLTTFNCLDLLTILCGRSCLKCLP